MTETLPVTGTAEHACVVILTKFIVELAVIGPTLTVSKPFGPIAVVYVVTPFKL